jgi:hypothetical protein
MPSSKKGETWLASGNSGNVSMQNALIPRTIATIDYAVHTQEDLSAKTILRMPQMPAKIQESSRFLNSPKKFA